MITSVLSIAIRSIYPSLVLISTDEVKGDIRIVSNDILSQNTEKTFKTTCSIPAVITSRYLRLNMNIGKINIIVEYLKNEIPRKIPARTVSGMLVSVFSVFASESAYAIIKKQNEKIIFWPLLIVTIAGIEPL